MPNWYYNAVHVSGEKEQRNTLAKLLAQQHFMTEDQGSEFNFANLVSIPEEKLEEYQGARGWQEGEEVGDTPFNWYNWNYNNWGVKWNASDVSAEPDEAFLSYYFSTPWGEPTPIIEALAQKCAELNLTFSWWGEEDQGFGREYEFDGSCLTMTNEWDIPTNHAEHKERGKDCICEWSTDPKDGFADCPKLK
jgi:hypothetical protein